MDSFQRNFRNWNYYNRNAGGSAKIGVKKSSEMLTQKI